jgi:molybdopterin molybdotransferase
MLALEHAQDQILARIQPLGAETIPLTQAQGRILAQTVTAGRDLPAFDNSAMDGYAVRAEDLKEASASNPVQLQLIGSAAAGEVFSGTVSTGQCVRVFTGSVLPQGTDAVIMQEDTRVLPEGAEQPLMLDRVKPWENVRFRGEDVKSGTSVLESGSPLGAAQLAVLAALGAGEVPVGRRPVLGLLATGSELRDPGDPLLPGQIYESNRLSLAALAHQAGAAPKVYPLVPDDLAATVRALQIAFKECDAVVTSGGVSVGEKDLVKAAFQNMGGELDFWRIAVKPGKPFALGSYEAKFLFGLPGNPVSALVTFLLLVRPALLKLQGAREWRLPTLPGVLQEPIFNLGDRRHFVRVHIDPVGQVRSAGRQASHILKSLAQANALLDLPPDTTLDAGTRVTVLMWAAPWT